MKSTKYSLTYSIFVIFGYLLILILSPGFSTAQAEVPPTVIKGASVYSIQIPDGPASTSFFVRLSGPSPEDITSCMVEGPSGSYALNVSSHSWPRSLGYYGSQNFIVADGTYTFTVTDSLGRTNSIGKEFIFDGGTVPRIDENSRAPAHESYTGTTMPTLSFASVDSGYRYKIYIKDCNDKMFVYNGLTTEETSVTIPEGFLQPDTLYKWYVRVYDSDNSYCPQQSDVYTFYTGSEQDAANLDNARVIDIEYPGNQLTWFGVRNSHIAPWDIHFLTVTDPDDNTFSLDYFSNYRSRSMYYSCSVREPFPLSDGEYNFGMELTDSSNLNTTTSFNRNPLPFFDEDSLSPAGNTYFDSEQLTFSWAPLFDPLQPDRTYYYRVRIYDVNARISCYDSPLTTNTSMTIPVAGTLPVGNSYYWRLVAYDSDNADTVTPIQHQTFSSIRRFTVADRQIMADFTAEVPGNPLTVNFSDSSKGNIISWHWDFGDGETSEVRNPVHAYGASGIYTVILTVNGPYGSDTKTKYYSSEHGLLNYPPPTIKDAGVISHNSLDSIFYTYISGPSPEDITSCIAEGPSGSFELSVSLHTWPHSLIYACIQNFIPEEGIYTFTVTDAAGRIATFDKEFFYDENIPRVDEGSCLPADESYTGTTMPTLGFAAPGTGLWYKFFITDYAGKMFVFQSKLTQDPSLIVPEGILQPDTAYKWFIRVSDSDYCNTQQSDTHTFYTGSSTEEPNLDTVVVTNFEIPGYQATWMGTRNNHVAPWDINFLTIADPDSNVFDLGPYTTYRSKPMFYSYMASAPPILSDGEYSFNLLAAYSSEIANTKDYIRNALPLIDESSLSPENNSYFDDKQIVFCWAPLFDPLQSDRIYHYMVRIYDVKGQISCYDSPLTTGTTITVPISGNLSVGNSYYWRLVVYDGDSESTPVQNNISSSPRRFTVADLPLTADFSFDNANGSLTVNFSNLSIGNLSGWYWDFGDGETSTAWNPVHSYAEQGSYAVTLRTFDFYGNSETKIMICSAGAGCSDLASFATAFGRVTGDPGYNSDCDHDDDLDVDGCDLCNFISRSTLRTILMATPEKGGIPLEVQFEAEITGGIPPYTIEWDLDGNGTADDNRQNFSYLYQSYGTYDVALIVHDSIGGTVADFVTIFALSAPTLIASANPTAGSAPLEVFFSATVNDPDGSIVLYEWDFDGDEIYDFSSLNSANTTFTYETSGLYQTTIRVTDNDDITATSTITIAVGSSPTASASAAPVNGPLPLEVIFSGSGTDPDGSINLYEWDFDGDGAYDWSCTTTGDTSYTYNSAGIFNAVFRVTDDDGLVDTDSVLISVSGPPISRPGAFPTSGEVPLTVTFFANGEDLDGSPEYYDWDFDGDGVNDQHLLASMNTTYTYNQAGTYNAILTVTDNEGLTGTASIVITVSEVMIQDHPTAIATAVPTNGGAPLQVTLVGKGLDEDGTITKLEWDFEGDGVFDFVSTDISGGTLGEPIDAGSNSSPALVDIDNDGDLDLFIGEYFGTIEFYRNDGDGSGPVWTSAGPIADSDGIPIDVGSVSRPDLVDIDNDGDFDLFIGENSGRIILYRNDGNSSVPIWTLVGPIADSDGTTIDVTSNNSPDLVDIDNDGDLDLFIGEYFGTIEFYRNDGDGSGPVWTSAGPIADSDGIPIDVGSVSSPVLVDIDNDGDLDLFIGENYGRIILYRNDGNSSVPIWTLVGPIADTDGSTIDTGIDPDLVDIDNDGDLDLFIGENYGRIILYHNDGNSSAPIWALNTESIGYVGVIYDSNPDLVDIDNDGDLDLFIGEYFGTIEFYRNDGNSSTPGWTPAGPIVDSNGIPINVGSRSSPVLVDIDNDGDLDLFIGGSSGRIILYHNDGNSSVPIWTLVGPITDADGNTIDTGINPDLVDIDNDGDLDLFIGENFGRIILYRNDGDSNVPDWTLVGYITNKDGTTIDAGSYNSPDLVDIDNDGDFDLFIGESGGRITFCRNDGNSSAPVWISEGFFTDSSGNTLDVGSYSSPVFADINGDNDYDAIIGNHSGFIYLYPFAGCVTHIYSMPGTYVATLRVTDNSDKTSTDSITITVLESGAPTATAKADPTSGEFPLDVSFNGTGNDADGTITLYEWDFDADGIYDWSSGVSGDTSHVYNNVGSHVATLRVTDNEGKSSTDSITISANFVISVTRTEIFDPVSGDVGSITSTIARDLIITVKVIDQSENAVRTLVSNEQRTTGTYTDTWDGKDDAGKIVRDGVYYFLVEHPENGETQTFDLRETAQYRQLIPSRTWPLTFDLYEEDRVEVTYSIPYPAEVSMYFWKRDYTCPESSIVPVRTMFLRKPKNTGSHTEIWDGVDDEGTVVGPWPGGYCITLWAYELPANAIIITGNTPVITDVEAESIFFCPAYNPYGSIESDHSIIFFNLSKTASVDVMIKNSDGIVVKSFNKTDLPAGANNIIWDGKDFDGELVKEGGYSISLTAIDNNGNRSLPRYAAIIIHY